MRHKLGVLALAIGVVLSVLAVVSSLTSKPTPSVGDVAAIETALISDFKPESTRGPSTSTFRTDPAPLPLWQEEIAADAQSVNFAPTPVSLRIAAIDVSAPVSPYGVKPSTGQMDVPRNVEEVAWYEHGPTPGVSGSAVLAAHVDLQNQGPGVFFRLEELRRGDFVYVGYDDGSERRFIVEARSTYFKEELPVEAIFSRIGPPVLTLITCGGGFSSSDRRYDSNVVVYAVPDTAGAPGGIVSGPIN